MWQFFYLIFHSSVETVGLFKLHVMLCFVFVWSSQEQGLFWALSNLQSSLKMANTTNFLFVSIPSSIMANHPRPTKYEPSRWPKILVSWLQPYFWEQLPCLRQQYVVFLSVCCAYYSRQFWFEIFSRCHWDLWGYCCCFWQLWNLSPSHWNSLLRFFL